MNHSMVDTHNHQHHADDMDIFGFWIYIMSDCILFSCLFATFAVLHTDVFGGATIKDITNLPYVFGETLALLLSSFTFGMAILSMYKNAFKRIVFWLVVTFVLGAVFVGMELNEFIHLAAEGHGWNTSAAMSAFFTLVGTHGFHVTMGLLWMLVMLIQLFTFGITPHVRRRMTYLGLFWAFLDIVWIFVFTIVYLMGAI